MRKIKVLELIEGSFLGGGQKNALYIAKNINKDKFEAVIASKGRGKFEKEVINSGIRFLDIHMPKVLRSRHLKNLIKIQEEEHFDIIHSHGGIAGFYGRILKRKMPQIKEVHTIHGIHYVNSESFLVHHISKAVEQYLVQYTDMIICVSENDRKVALKMKIAKPQNTEVIFPGINIENFINKPRDNELRKKLGIKESDFVVGNVSRFDVQKNQKLIVQAAYYLVKLYPEMKFVFVGDGEHMERIKDYVFESNLKDFFIFTGEVSDVENYYPLFDVFVFPTFWEGLPAVLLEAMASEVPVISSSLPEIRDIVEDGFSALLIDPNDADELMSKITMLHENKELREFLSGNALKAVYRYDQKDMITKIEDLYERIIS